AASHRALKELLAWPEDAHGLQVVGGSSHGCTGEIVIGSARRRALIHFDVVIGCRRPEPDDEGDPIIASHVIGVAVDCGGASRRWRLTRDLVVIKKRHERNSFLLE